VTECVHTPLQYIVEANIMYVVTLSGVMLCNVLLCVCVVVERAGEPVESYCAYCSIYALILTLHSLRIRQW
jgi:hypothetical protein